MPAKVERQLKRVATDTHPLTAREREVVGLVAQGRKNREIAQQLCITEQTVKNHLQSIFDKLGASNRYEATRRLAHLYEYSPAVPVHQHTFTMACTPPPLGEEHCL